MKTGVLCVLCRLGAAAAGAAGAAGAAAAAAGADAVGSANAVHDRTTRLLPCDILSAAGNPCVAAHSTVRSLYMTYAGPLYNVTRSSDGKSALIGVLQPGGYANITAHEAFCSKLDCVVSNIMDQSPQRNHLGQRHKLVNASKHKIMAGGKEVYGLWFDPGYG